ncbi:MAG: 4Fe-4S ferredoxin [Spartobacteria bacterium]|nr:4Fe-4S ferredoxin [Spartobacteria bacterium]
MKRKIISIDEARCNGCGLCVSACHEGAIQLIDGKAKLVSDSYCDGLGDCLPACPVDAIRIVEREAADYDEAAVAARQAAAKGPAAPAAPAPAAAKPPLPCGCPGTLAKAIARTPTPQALPADAPSPPVAQLGNWPVQIKLVNVRAPYLQNAALLIAADCTAFAYADIHHKFMRNRVTLIGCPKLDEGDYAEKLTAILQANEIKSVTVLRMEVPCCGGIAAAVQRALQASGKTIPWQVVTISTDGAILDD